MYVIAGLGNPDRKYKGSRHNIGFDAVDAIAKKYGLSFRRQKYRAKIAKGTIEGIEVLLAKPQTYMNNSGESLCEIVSAYHLKPERDLCVIYDDIYLSPGNLRIRTSGSAGGHNGIKSIIACLGTEDFMRIKIGVGEKPPGGDLIEHVLGHMNQQDREWADAAIAESAEAVPMLMRGEVQEAMSRFNGKRRQA